MAKKQPLLDTDPKSFGHWVNLYRLDSRKDKLIYLAKSNDQLAAVKVIKNADLMTTDEWEKFAFEIKSLKQMVHPNIPKYLDSDLSNSYLPWLASEFIDGDNLLEIVSSDGPLDIAMWMHALEGVLEALAYVHSLGIVHRDVSPSNVILSASNAFLIDFGISRRSDSTVSTASIGQAGTPATESPEHLKNSPDPKMDIFSLASTFTYAGTGHFPFPTEPPSEWINSILHGPPDLSGLSELQMKLLIPMFYKKATDRISATDALAFLSSASSRTNSWISETHLPEEQHLRESDQKLVDPAPFAFPDIATRSKRQSFDFRRLSLGLAFSLVALAIASFWFLSPDRPGSTPSLNTRDQEVAASPTPQLSTTPDEIVISGPIGQPSKDLRITKEPVAPGAVTPLTREVLRTPTPLLSSDKFDVSAPLASDVVYDSLYGRPWKTGGLYWGIPLQFSSASPVPDLTGIQFRPIGFPNGPWIEVPYKLKVSSVDGSVYAQVDELLFAVLFKGEICPEFRVVKEVDGEIVKVWTKGDSECADDYRPSP